MTKSSKSCGYTGRMHILNRKNNTKSMYESNQAHQHGHDESQVTQHPHCKTAYPEEKARQCSKNKNK